MYRKRVDAYMRPKFRKGVCAHGCIRTGLKFSFFQVPSLFRDLKALYGDQAKVYISQMLLLSLYMLFRSKLLKSWLRHTTQASKNMGGSRMRRPKVGTGLIDLSAVSSSKIQIQKLRTCLYGSSSTLQVTTNIWATLRGMQENEKGVKWFKLREIIRQGNGTY